MNDRSGLRRARLQVLLLTMGAVMAYGVVHDQATARICVEYFTVAHPRLFATESPALLGLLWGVAATAPVGLLFGGLLASVSQPSSGAGTPLSQIARGLLRLAFAMGIGATAAGALAWSVASLRWIPLMPAAWADAVPESRHARFAATWGSHMASYLIGAVGAVRWWRALWKAHGRPQVISLWPRDRAEAIRVVAVIVAGAAVAYWRFHPAR